MLYRPLIVVVMICSLVLAGCQVDTHPLDVANFSTTRAPTKVTAPYNGNFILYSDDNAAVVGPLLMTVHLKAGELLGFEFDDNHAPAAFAGDKHMQLSPGRYRWEMTPDVGQTDWPQTNAVVLEVAVAAVVVTLAVFGSILAAKRL